MVVYDSVWHMRAALGEFVRQHADYSGDDNSFLVAAEEDRYDATQDSYTAVHLLDLNELILHNSFGSDDLRAASIWTRGPCCCGLAVGATTVGASPVQPDEARNSAFSVAWCTLKEAARLMSPHLAAGSTACMVSSIFLTSPQFLSIM